GAKRFPPRSIASWSAARPARAGDARAAHELLYTAPRVASMRRDNVSRSGPTTAPRRHPA
ncbi:MAG: hypothetical protein KC897_13900, partial [Candidatus Omnitrophica bacterium]|nr:hypothetical protein [Candidatus Omnitrophota bacterium]